MDTEYYHEIKLIIFIHQQIHCTKYLIYIYLQSFEIYVIFRGKLKSLGLIKKLVQVGLKITTASIDLHMQSAF